MNKKIAIITFYDNNHEPFGKISDISKKAYCAKWRYTYILQRERISPMFDHPVWEKPQIMLNNFKNFDYIVWLDADACIANMTFDIGAIFINDKHIYMSEDCFGYNAGVFALKNSDISKQFLEDTKAGYESFRTARFREQSCMSYLMDNKYKEYVHKVPIRLWNCYEPVYGHPINNPYKEGDFILHLPARSHEDRIKRFTEINQKNRLTL